MTDLNELEAVDIGEPVVVTKRKPKACRCCYENKALKSMASVTSTGTTKLVSGARGLFNEFSAFINKGNVFQNAVAFILALQFNAVITSLVNDIIMPPIGLATSSQFSEMYLVLRYGRSFFNQTTGQPISPPPPIYATVQDGLNDKAVLWLWGRFVQSVVNFFLVALILFGLVLLYSRYLQLKKRLLNEKDPFAPTMKDCPLCLSSIDSRVKRCKFCGHDNPFPEETKKE